MVMMKDVKDNIENDVTDNVRNDDRVPIHPVSFPRKGVSGQTGTWRLEKPVINKDTCTSCLLCWVFCPEAVIEKETFDIDYMYCKGCGICAEECPVKAIDMVREGRS